MVRGSPACFRRWALPPSCATRALFIRELATETTCPGGARYFSVFSNMDNFVLPVSTAVLHGAEENIHVPYLGHCALLYSTRVMDQVERCLLAPIKDS